MANRHAQQIVEGEVLACRWAKAAAQRQLNDLAKFKGKSSPYEFNPRLQSKAGQPFRRPTVLGWIGVVPNTAPKLLGDVVCEEFQRHVRKAAPAHGRLG
jgi:hypothetical protein